MFSPVTKPRSRTNGSPIASTRPGPPSLCKNSFRSAWFRKSPATVSATPGSNQGKINGRDHNHHGFTTWLAGGGVKGGFHYGETDEIGHKAVVNRVGVHDLQATLLHALGLDHEKLTFKFQGLDQRLTGVEKSRVVQEIFA